MRAVVTTVMLLLVAAGVAATWAWRAQERAMRSPLNLGAAGRHVVVEEGMSLRRVAESLADTGVLDSPERLVWHARWTGQAVRIKAGEYAIPPGTTPAGLLALLVSGKVVQRSLTLVEGWTFRDIMRAVRTDEHLQHTLDGLGAAEVMARLGYPGVHPEGRFFADTYLFPMGTTDVAYLKRAYVTMERYLADAWERRDADLPLASADDALILASIVEKETAVPGERARIAGVFVQRLRKRMRLETDPSVIYGMGEAFDGNLRRRDLKHDTPYNTYVHKGLPPTPIATPGAAAIEAVLHPGTDGSLYFVSKGDGSHYFSTTYSEHRKAVARYQLRRPGSGRPRKERRGG